jgi:hypothetical protein
MSQIPILLLSMLELVWLRDQTLGRFLDKTVPVGVCCTLIVWTEIFKAEEQYSFEDMRQRLSRQLNSHK